MRKCLAEAVEAFQQSQFARRTFGDEMVEFYLKAANQEPDTPSGEVTVEELARYFERI